jgi:hypothetical protein
MKDHGLLFAFLLSFFAGSVFGFIYQRKTTEVEYVCVVDSTGQIRDLLMPENREFYFTDTIYEGDMIDLLNQTDLTSCFYDY